MECQVVKFGMHFLLICVLFVHLSNAKSSDSSDSEKQTCLTYQTAGLVGGWNPLKFQNDKKLEDELAAAINFFLKGEYPHHKLRVTSKGQPKITQVYTQVVAGINYCIEFETVGCTNGANYELCNIANKENMICTLEIYKPPLSVLLQGKPLSYEFTDHYCKVKKFSPK